MIKLSPKTWLILALAAVLVEGYFLYEIVQKKNSLEKSVEVLGSELESRKNRNEQKIDSLDQVADIRQRHLLELSQDYEALEIRYKKINTKENENETAIRAIRAVDSMRNEIARHYR